MNAEENYQFAVGISASEVQTNEVKVAQDWFAPYKDRTEWYNTGINSLLRKRAMKNRGCGICNELQEVLRDFDQNLGALESALEEYENFLDDPVGFTGVFDESGDGILSEVDLETIRDARKELEDEIELREGEIYEAGDNLRALCRSLANL